MVTGSLTRSGDVPLAPKTAWVAVRWNGQPHRKVAIVTCMVGKTTSRQEEVMQVLCRRTNGHAEFHCCVCGQGFVMFWERQSRSERMSIMGEIQETMRRQHRAASGREAHPQDGFLAPQMGGSLEPVGAGVAGGVPAWDL